MPKEFDSHELSILFDVIKAWVCAHSVGRNVMDNLTARRSLTTNQQLMVNAEFEKRKKSKLITYLLWIFLGIFGGHRFYSGDNGIAIGMLVVCVISWFLMFIPITVWAIIDVFLIGKRIDKLNEQLETTIIQKVKMIHIVTTT